MVKINNAFLFMHYHLHNLVDSAVLILYGIDRAYITITSIFTFKNAIDNPGIVRIIVGAYTTEGYTYIIEQYRKGIASYGMPHAFFYCSSFHLCIKK